MKNFFQGFNSSRAMIVIFLLASVYLGYEAYAGVARVEQARARLGLDEAGVPMVGPNAPVHDLLRRIVHQAKRYTDFKEQLASDGMEHEDNLQSYIRNVAVHQKIGLGRINVTTQPTKSIFKGSQDREFRIRHKDTKADFSRLQACNFMFKLEDGSNRIRVTEFRMSAADRTEPEDIPNDRWTFECKVTMREKEGG
jgi:hypothetical protein